MTLSFPHLTTRDSWRFGIGVYYSPAIKDDSVDYDLYFDGEVGIDLFIGPFTIGVRLTWEHK
jgi:hypothetical protein